MKEIVSIQIDCLQWMIHTTLNKINSARWKLNFLISENRNKNLDQLNPSSRIDYTYLNQIHKVIMEWNSPRGCPSRRTLAVSRRSGNYWTEAAVAEHRPASWQSRARWVTRSSTRSSAVDRLSAFRILGSCGHSPSLSQPPCRYVDLVKNIKHSIFHRYKSTNSSMESV